MRAWRCTGVIAPDCLGDIATNNYDYIQKPLLENDRKECPHDLTLLHFTLCSQELHFFLRSTAKKIYTSQ